ncbi:MAG: LVIVD repeat-containing protein, partial [Actinomycetes bacterium]
MRLRTLTVPTAALALALAGPAAPALAHGGDPTDKVVFKQVLAPQTEGGTAKNMEFVANVPYQVTGGTRGMGGTDVEFARIGGKDYAFGGTYQNGMQIVDISKPEDPELVAVYDCKILQGDVQVFKQGTRVLAAYTADSAFGPKGAGSQCGQDLRIPSNKLGTVLVDVTNPREPESVSFIEVPQGSHNMTVHPSGDYLYNSNSDLITSTAPNIAIFDIRRPDTPVLVQNYRIPFIPTSLGSESHDITFSEDGTRAYSAALSQTLVLDTTRPWDPSLVSQVVDPAVQVSHGADPITLTAKDGKERTFLLVSDEQLGAATGTNCPGGGVHVYDITGANEKAPKKMGAWFIGEAKPSTATCTAHVFRMHGDQGLFTIAWYDQGVRVVDVQGLADQPVPAVPFVVRGDGSGIREIGRFTFDDHNTWAFKTNEIEKDGSFYGYGNDLGRGFDVYRFEGLGRTVPAL